MPANLWELEESPGTDPVPQTSEENTLAGIWNWDFSPLECDTVILFYPA